jgi:hypothetical protein
VNGGNKSKIAYEGMHMNQMKWLFLGLILFGCLACGPTSGTKTFEYSEFTFSYPSNWQPMSELWPNYTDGKEYYQLGVEEIIQVTSVQKQGGPGAYFAVSARELPRGQDLEDLCDQAYQPYAEDLRDFAKNPVNLGGKPGYAFDYSRPWGEPWWQFRDIWVESNGTVYMFSFHALNLEHYEKEIDSIFQSIVFN